MKTRILVLIAAALILTGSAVAQDTVIGPESKISNTRRATCLIKITCDPDILPLSFQTVEYLMHSSSVVRQILDRPAEEAPGLITIEPLTEAPSTPDGKPAPGGTYPGKTSTPDEEADYFRRREEQEYRALGKVMPQYMPTQRKKSANETILENTLLFHLTVAFDKDVKPAATECMNAVIENLRRVLNGAFLATQDTLENELALARHYKGIAEEQLSLAVGTRQTDDSRTREQLDQAVDLSALNPEMPFGEAIDLLKRSVDPPLKMVLLWADLHSNAVDQTTPINIDGLQEAPLGKALELVLKSVSFGKVQLGYVIDKGIITVATADNLPPSEQNFEQMVAESVSIEELTKQRKNLLADKQMTEMNREISSARCSAMKGQLDSIRVHIRERLESDPMIKELQQIMDRLSQLSSGRTADERLRPLEALLNATMRLAEQKEKVAQAAGADRMVKYNREIADIEIDFYVQDAQLGMTEKQLAEVEKQLKAASALQPKLSRIRLARRELDSAERRVIESQARLAQLMQPTVTVIGAD